MLSAMDGAEHGSQFWLPSVSFKRSPHQRHQRGVIAIVQQHYYKVLAFKIEPNPGSRGLISIDGEAFPWGPFYVEVHRGLAWTLSPYGQYKSTFISTPKKATKK
jgi:sphingosine kinase